jgi:hypothetical protein
MNQKTAKAIRKYAKQQSLPIKVVKSTFKRYDKSMQQKVLKQVINLDYKHSK